MIVNLEMPTIYEHIIMREIRWECSVHACSFEPSAVRRAEQLNRRPTIFNAHPTRSMLCRCRCMRRVLSFAGGSKRKQVEPFPKWKLTIWMHLHTNTRATTTATVYLQYNAIDVWIVPCEFIGRSLHCPLSMTMSCAATTYFNQRWFIHC
jgi:hypothetical protein